MNPLPVADNVPNDPASAEESPYISRNQPIGLSIPRSLDHSYRLFLPKNEGWVADIKRDWRQEYCYAKNPGENWFHLLANGEIYVQHGNEKYCLHCALRLRRLTTNRLWWQKGTTEEGEDLPESPAEIPPA